VVLGSFLIFQATGNTYLMAIAFLVGLLVQVGFFRRLGLGQRARGRG